ncbi:MAG: hypothetical protein ACFB3T_03160 [Geminicoccaceae bacterium]
MFRSTSNRVAGATKFAGLALIMAVGFGAPLVASAPAKASEYVVANCLLVGTDECTFTDYVSIGRRGHTQNIRGQCWDYSRQDTIKPQSMTISERDKHTTCAVQGGGSDYIGQNCTAWSWRHRDTVKVTLNCKR